MIIDNFETFIIAIAILGILFYFLKNKIFILFKPKEKYSPFKKKTFLMNTPERKFFEELQKTIPDDYIIFPQVLLSNIVKVACPKKYFWKYQNKINKKTIDYVIFDKPYFEPILAIEYDGKTHNEMARAKRDVEVKNILDSADIKNFHVKHKDVDLKELKNKIDKILLNKKY